MTTTEISKTATKIVNAIKAGLKERKDLAKTHPFCDRAVYVEYDSEYDPKAGKYLDYIKVGKQYFRGMTGDIEMNEITRQIMIGLERLKADSRTYKNLTYTTREYSRVDSWRKIVEIDKVQLPENPCKEFKSLQNYLKNQNLKPESMR